MYIFWETILIILESTLLYFSYNLFYLSSIIELLWGLTNRFDILSKLQDRYQSEWVVLGVVLTRLGSFDPVHIHI